MRRVLILMALLSALVAAAPAAAGEGRFNPTEVYREVRCPTCNTPLDVSNAPIAQRMKAFIVERWREGWTRTQVIDALVEEFGREVLTTPPKSGFDLIAWVVPGLALAGGLVVIGGVVLVWTRRRRGASEEAEELSEADKDALARELERFGGL